MLTAQEYGTLACAKYLSRLGLDGIENGLGIIGGEINIRLSHTGRRLPDPYRDAGCMFRDNQTLRVSLVGLDARLA